MRPLDLGRRSSDEYVAPPLSPSVTEAARRAREAIERLRTGGALSRREVLASAAASAAVLSALTACSREERASRGAPEPGGGFAAPGGGDAVIDPAEAAEALARGGPVVDVQLHFLDPARNADFGGGFPQASCGAADWRACFSAEALVSLVFDQSDTQVGLLSGLPITGADSPLSIEVMDDARRRLESAGGGRRLLLQAPVHPAAGPLDQALDAMAADAATYPVAGWKTYTSLGPYRLDDERGDALLDQAVRLGRPVVAVHKGVAGEDPAASPADIGPAARAHPGAQLVVYHSGWEPTAPEGPFAAGRPERELRGVDRLIASLKAAGIGPEGNVYAELGTTWFNVARDPDAAAHVLGKLLAQLGPRRILWGTDSIWYGSPQGQIDAFRTFQISERLQEQHGYPALTDEAKALILGGNARRLYGI
ncbi:MAG: amidohydrolase family protein [Acidimicrobiales bacterium]